MKISEEDIEQLKKKFGNGAKLVIYCPTGKEDTLRTILENSGFEIKRVITDKFLTENVGLAMEFEKFVDLGTIKETELPPIEDFNPFCSMPAAGIKAVLKEHEQKVQKKKKDTEKWMKRNWKKK